MATSTHLGVASLVAEVVASASPSSTHRVAPQGGILEGGDPSVYNSSNPIILFIIQAGIIILFCRLLHYPLSLLRQPRVIAEVIGGILLGPSVMGHVPGFTATVFPKEAMPNLNLVANLGLVLFLFLVGLEVDLRYFVRNWKVALSVGTASMALPFGLGCAIAWGLYNEFRNEPGTVPIQFGTYMLFIAVAMSITAFPVLCRILTELKLLRTPVGIIVLSAGVGNDVIGWILLALCVALVNAGSGLTALWVLLTCVGYVLFLTFAVRPAFMWVLRRSGSLHDGPSQSIVALTLIITLASAFFTGVIGVHPIFGAFLAGLICPHEGGFAVKVTEKIEDLISALFLPLYFALSGLSTNLGLLDSGITWAYVIGVIAVAFCSKFSGAMFAAKASGLVWRESAAIGSLMSCKGLVELIVLNIGLQAKILSSRTFTIFVIMALVTTFATTPMTAWLYPAWYQRKLEAWKRGELDWTTGRPSEVDVVAVQKLGSKRMESLLVYLRLDNMPTLLAFVSLLGGKPGELVAKKHPMHEKDSSVESRVPTLPGAKSSIQVHGMRLLELTERTSAVMKVSEVDDLSLFDPVLNAFRVLGQLYNLAVSGETNVVPEALYADTLANKAAEDASDLLVVPWSETGNMSEAQATPKDSVRDKLASEAYSAFVTKTLEKAECTTAVFVNNGFSGSSKPRKVTRQRSMSVMSLHGPREHAVQRPNVNGRSHHIFLPFFGGADGRAALRLVLQLAENPEVTATILHLLDPHGGSNLRDSSVVTEHATVTAKGTASGLAQWPDDGAFFSSMQHELQPEVRDRVIMETLSSVAPIQDAIQRAQMEVAQDVKNGGDVIVLARNSTSPATPSSGHCLGEVADKFVDAGIRASLLIVQARKDLSE
ncbi:hypothetical protein LTR86_010588 [Recurvomyces mirabilis]|nr:hypothetical protein LTR86_010588 [Recurvomyces mirabilis]